MIQFDEYQQKIIDITTGSNLVLAAPGCGKTAILAERVRKALDRGVKTEDMLCLTFTNRAARNMVSRINENGIENIFVGNIHRFCAHLLFDTGTVPTNASIIDDTDIYSIILELRGSKVPLEIITSKQKNAYMSYVNLQHFFKQYRNGHDKNIILNKDCLNTDHILALCNVLNLEYTRKNIIRIYDCIHSQNDIDALLKDKSFIYTDLLEQILYAKKYEEYKAENNLIDFDDILIDAYDYLNRSVDIKKYKWVQIDEVQDLNPLQIAITDLITENDACTLYLGDDQQSIFSFIGAKASTMQYLKNKCNGNIFTLQRNYRSPEYLLNVYNSYAINVLNVPGEMLPTPSGKEKAEEGSLIIKHSYSNETAINDTLKMYSELKSDGRTAIIVPTNKDADEFSDLAADIPHFKISGTDYFSSDEVLFAINHLNVLACDTDYMAWAKIFKSLGLTTTLAIARKTAIILKETAITPSDFLLYENSSYINEHKKAYADKTCVIFDTETTGLDVYDDDIVQLAAIKIRNKKIVDKYNVIMTTDLKIPEMLGDIVNPLIEEYNNTERVSHNEGLTGFLDFAEDCVLIGHNVEFDFHILDFNLKKYCKINNLNEIHPEYYDTLKLARLVIPGVNTYKLKNLLEQLNLQGENSHLADDDIIATKSLADYILKTISQKEFEEKHLKMLSRTEQFRENFRELYRDLFINAKCDLYVRGNAYQIAREFINIKEYLQKRKIAVKSKKYDYIIRFIMSKVDENTSISSTSSLYEQNTAMNADLNTFRESDLCDTEIIEEKLFISTVHKAKGLEFDNVFVFGAVDGTYPHFCASSDDERMEDARKFYVALSRAKKRLIIVAYDHYLKHTERGTLTYQKDMSPFVQAIKTYFTTQNYYYPTKPYATLPSEELKKRQEE